MKIEKTKFNQKFTTNKQITDRSQQQQKLSNNNNPIMSQIHQKKNYDIGLVSVDF